MSVPNTNGVVTSCHLHYPTLEVPIQYFCYVENELKENPLNVVRLSIGGGELSWCTSFLSRE